MLFYSLNPFIMFSHSFCFIGGFFSSLLGAGVADSVYLVIACREGRVEGSLFSHRGAGKDVGNSISPFPSSPEI